MGFPEIGRPCRHAWSERVEPAALGGLGLIPTGARPSRGDIFGSIRLDYKLALSVLGVAIFAALMYMSMRRGVTDPVCGMKVDRSDGMPSKQRSEEE